MPRFDREEDRRYYEAVNALPTAEERVAAVMRHSRYVNLFFPFGSSGAGDLIEEMLGELRDEWNRERSSN